MNLVTIQTFTNILGLIMLVGGAILILASKVKSDNLADLKDRVAILETEREEARKQHIENQKAIANLEGQLSTYKEIPLKQIAQSLTELSKSNDKILNVLENSALIAATERGVLTPKDQHIENQTVEKQVIAKPAV